MKKAMVAVLLVAGCTSRGTSSGTAPGAAAPGSTAAPVSPTFTPVAPVPTAASTARTKTAHVVARSGEGFLEDQGGARLLHVKGSPRERGRQYGELLGGEIDAIMADVNRYAGTLPISLPSFVLPLIPTVIAPLYEPYFPKDALDTLDGIVEGAARRSPPVALTRDQLVFLNALIDLGALVQLPAFKCSGLAVWGPLTRQGKLYQMRNVDLMVGSGLESHSVAVIEKPDQGSAFLNAGWSGMIGSASGMNEHGLGVSQVWAYSNDANIGQPWILTNRTLLGSTDSVDSVFKAYSSVQRTYGSNFVFADRGDGRGGSPRAIALESTFADLAQFVDADPTEDSAWNGASLSIRIPNAVFRGDLALCSRIYARQYDMPKTKDPRTSGWYQNRYEHQATMTADFAAKGVAIGADEMKQISRTIAMRSSSLQCVVYENTDLVVHVANSRVVAGGAPVDACDEPFNTFDLDYYLPTASVALDHASYAVGDVMGVTVTVGNHGRDRVLDARVSLGATRWTLAGIKVGTGATGVAAGKLTIPAGTPLGATTVVVELVEAGTGDVVDYAVAAVTVQ